RHTHLQVMDTGDPHLGRLLTFRDALRSSPDARDAYSVAKREALRAWG
ncbi:MAG: GrpB family protein, partial [Euzebya sp.]